MEPLPRPLVLASTSVHRRALLDRLGLPFDVEAPEVDEAAREGEAPRDTALRLSIAKAEAVAARRRDAIVIGSDQVAACEGRAMGKPGGHEAAVRQLTALRGRDATFHSGLCVIAPAPMRPRSQADVVATRVRFRAIGDAEIEAYLLAEAPYDCAGSAKSEGLGIALLERVTSDDPTALVGLPLIRLVTMLGLLGVSPLR